jgi:alpha-beta hydrolase superfamily lysophospholipase
LQDGDRQINAYAREKMAEEQKANLEQSGYLARKNQPKIFYRSYLPKNEKLRVLLVHGFGEYSERYKHVINTLNALNWGVVAFDLRGHGASEGDRGDIISLHDYEEDILAAINWAWHNNQSKQLFVIAHSMGAMLSLRLAEKQPRLFSGLVLSCPLLALKLPVPAWKKTAATCLTKYWPTLRLSTGIRGTLLSSDQSVAQSYDKDPLILKRLSIRTFRQLVQGFEDIEKLKMPFPVNFLMQIAGKDPVVCSRTAEQWYDKAKKFNTQLEIKKYPNFLHEIYNEIGGEKAILDAVEWISARSKELSLQQG